MPQEIDIPTLLRRLPEHANAQPPLRRIGRHCTVQFLLEAGGDEFYFNVDRGAVAAPVEGPLRMYLWRFAVRAPNESWRAFWQPIPAVGFQDIFAMVRFGHARIDGDLGPMLEHLRYIKSLLAAPREILMEHDR